MGTARPASDHDDMSDSKDTKTNKILFEPAPGTVVKPIWKYDEEQTAKIEALREVSFLHMQRRPFLTVVVRAKSAPSRI